LSASLLIFDKPFHQTAYDAPSLCEIRFAPRFLCLSSAGDFLPNFVLTVRDKRPNVQARRGVETGDVFPGLVIDSGQKLVVVKVGLEMGFEDADGVPVRICCLLREKVVGFQSGIPDTTLKNALRYTYVWRFPIEWDCAVVHSVVSVKHEIDTKREEERDGVENVDTLAVVLKPPVQSLHRMNDHRK
jgi:hypothetical protein